VSQNEIFDFKADKVMSPSAASSDGPGSSGDAGPAIFFHVDQVEGLGRNLNGRRSAGSGFLHGWIAHSEGDEIRALVSNQNDAKELAEILQKRGETRPLRAVSLKGGDFTGFGCVFFPGPNYKGATWRRQRLGPNRVSLVGVTHTVSTRKIVERFHSLMSEPVEDWDAIICTSRAVRSVVARHFESEAEYFRCRFGATRVPQPQLPIIPLGVNASAFAPREGAREVMRAAHGAPEDAVVVMTMGRLSVVEKANPVPLLLALQEIAPGLGRPLHLWMVGFASRPEEEALHREAAQLSPSVKVQIIDGRDPQIRRDAWAGADIFTLPSDSIQETFGLVPVEAMAAGLPVVMPDWDGFRDTVLHGETGFLVPTRMAPPGMGRSLGRRFANGADGYLQHLVQVQAQVQIDIPAYSRALDVLVRDPSLRARMGKAGQRHVAQKLDWSRVVPLYLDLAKELAERRASGVPTTPALRPEAPSPLELDPFALYADYPSALISMDTPVHPGPRRDAAFLELASRVSGQTLYRRPGMAPELALSVLNAVATRPGLSVLDIAKSLDLRPAPAIAAVLSLAKFDALRLPELPHLTARPSTSSDA
jgi:glycosyltransferase involved in cell wall biosynthesis